MSAILGQDILGLSRPQVEGRFKLSLYSEQPVTLTAVTPATDWQTQALSGRWRPGCAGGCRNNAATWRDNPRFALQLLTPGVASIRLSQQWEADDGSGRGTPAIGFYVLRAGGGELGHTETFLSGEGVVKEFAIGDTDRYEILPCTFEPGRHRPFTLAVYADGPFDFSGPL